MTTKLRVRIRTDEGIPQHKGEYLFCDCWLMVKEGASRQGLLKGYIPLERAYQLAEALGVVVEHSHLDTAIERDSIKRPKRKESKK